MVDAQTKRGVEVMEAIRKILFEDWDPIGVNDNPNLRDEYDSYIAPVYRLLVDGASQEQIVSYLWKLEHDLGMAAKSQDHLPLIASQLMALNVKLDSNVA